MTDEALLEAFAESEPRQENSPEGFRVYPEVLRAVMHDLGEKFHCPVSEEDTEAFAGSVGDWPPFPDTVEALQKLKEQHRLVVVSNVDRASFSRTEARLGVEFDAVVTAEDVGAYKPGLKMFHRAFEVVAAWGIGQNEILHVAQSLYHDHVPAKALGLATCWVNRRQTRPGSGATQAPTVSIEPAWTVNSLEALVLLENSTASSKSSTD